MEYAQARYYNAQHGRFTSVDPLTASATIKDPQSFNRYSYGLNSPYKFTDPLGLIPEHKGSGGETKDCTKGCYINGNFYDPLSSVVTSRPTAESPTSPPAPASSQTNSSSHSEVSSDENESGEDDSARNTSRRESDVEYDVGGFAQKLKKLPKNVEVRTK